MTKVKLDRLSIATRYGVKHDESLHDNDYIDCLNCEMLGGSALHQLLLQNPNAHLYIVDWQEDDLNSVLDYMQETGQGDIGSISYEIVKDD